MPCVLSDTFELSRKNIFYASAKNILPMLVNKHNLILELISKTYGCKFNKRNNREIKFGYLTCEKYHDIQVYLQDHSIWQKLNSKEFA